MAGPPTSSSIRSVASTGSPCGGRFSSKAVESGRRRRRRGTPVARRSRWRSRRAAGLAVGVIAAPPSTAMVRPAGRGSRGRGRRRSTLSGLKLAFCHARESRASICHAGSSALISLYVARIWRTPCWSLPMMSVASWRVNGMQVVVGDDVVDEAELQRLLGEHEVAGEAHLPGPAHADRLGQQHRHAPAGHHADAGVGVAELGALAGDEEVAVRAPARTRR